MTRIGIGFVAAVALATVACASTRSAKAGSGATGGETIATAAQTGGAQSPSVAAGAQGDAAGAQGDATSADATSAGASTKEVEGRIELLDRANNVTLAGTESVGRAFERFKIDEDTEILVDGEQATLAEVHPGDEVRASFSGEGDELRIERLEVITSDE